MPWICLNDGCIYIENHKMGSLRAIGFMVLIYLMLTLFFGYAVYMTFESTIRFVGYAVVVAIFALMSLIPVLGVIVLVVMFWAGNAWIVDMMQLAPSILADFWFVFPLAVAAAVQLVLTILIVTMSRSQ